MLDQGCLGSLGRCMAGVAHALAEPPPPQCPFPGDTEEEVFECIVNADAPYPRFLSVQGLELLQKVITAESGAGPDNCLSGGPVAACPWGPVVQPAWSTWGRRQCLGSRALREHLSSRPAPPEVPGEAPGGQ